MFLQSFLFWLEELAAACLMLISYLGQALSEVGANIVNQNYPGGGYYLRVRGRWQTLDNRVHLLSFGLVILSSNFWVLYLIASNTLICFVHGLKSKCVLWLNFISVYLLFNSSKCWSGTIKRWDSHSVTVLKCFLFRGMYDNILMFITVFHGT